MSQASLVQSSFNNGVISERMYGHTALEKYASSVAEMENMVPWKHGPAVRRPSTNYVIATKFNNKYTRLQDFQYNTVQTYMLEFGEYYVRFHADQGNVESSPSVPLEVVTPYAEADLAGLSFTQSNDVLYIVHEDYEPKELVRTSHTSWTLDPYVHNDGPYQDANTDPNKKLVLSPGAIGVGNTSTMTATGFTPFAAGDVGRSIRLHPSGANEYAGWVKITGYTSSTIVTVTHQDDELTGANASSEWRFDAWGTESDHVYPSTVTFHQQRLFFGYQQTIWSTAVVDFNSFKPENNEGDVQDDNGLTYKISSDQVNFIQWMKSGRVLFVGTLGGEYKLTAEQDAALTPNNIKVTRETRYGCAQDVEAIFAGPSVIFAQRAGRKLRQITFDFNTDTYLAPDLSLMSYSLTKGGIKQMAYQNEPNGIVWCVLNDGGLRGMTLDFDQNVIGWSTHTLGGTDVEVQSVATMTSSLSDGEELWTVVRRTVNSATVQYVEYSGDEFEFTTDQEDAYFLDSAISYSGAPTTSFSGLGHLEGETVSILTDGAVHTPQVVSSGAITLDEAGSEVHVGLPYTSRIKSLAVSTEALGNPNMGVKQKIFEVNIRVMRSLGMKYGSVASDLSIIPTRDSTMLMNGAPALYTGDLKLPVRGNWGTQTQAVIETSDPLPLNLLAIVYRLNFNAS